MAKRVFITGVSGFLGINLARYLKEKGYDIKGIDKVPFDYSDDVDFFLGDIRDKAKVKEAMKHTTAVIHCAAALPLYKKDEIYSTDVNGTRNVLEAADELGIKRVVHISTTAVYGIPKRHPLYEDSQLEGVGPYGEAKIQAEKICLQYRKKLIVPILRPKSFVGPERLGVMAIYYDWIRRAKHVPIIGSGRNRYQLLDVEDLCEAIRLCLVKPKKAVNDTFNIGAKEYTTMAEDFGAVLKHAGYGRKIIPTPSKPLILILRLLEKLKLSPLYKWVYETAPKHSFVSIEKAEKQLGFKPKYSNKEALIRNYEWYLNNLDSFNKTGVTHRVPWKQGILRFISWFF